MFLKLTLEDADECVLYGNSGKPALVASCTTGASNTRTLTCQVGAQIVGTAQQQTITLTGSAVFPGCEDINECVVYGLSLKPNNVLTPPGCINGVNRRTITCQPGYYIAGGAQSVVSADYIGNAAFPGCLLADFCSLYGFSGKPQNAKCVPGINQRTITCNDGYYAVSPNNPIVVLTGNAPFQGCVDIAECTVYAYTGKPSNALCTEPTINTRTITCSPGYYITGTTPISTSVITSVSLTGNAPFNGCSDLDECAVYSTSGRPANVEKCVQGVNQRTITCDDGFLISGRMGNAIVATYIGSQPFGGCGPEDYCTRHGFSGKPENTRSCVTGIKNRTLTCLAGYYVTAPDIPSILLVNDGLFTGCFDIDECSVYGTNGKSDSVQNCAQGVNERTILCNPGYSVVGKPVSEVQVKLVGKANFTGCQDIDECKEYGFSGKNANTKPCVQGINNRTLSCQDGYHITGGRQTVTSAIYIGNAAFPGCSLTNLCDVLGYDGNESPGSPHCDPGVNTRNITCSIGYAAAPPGEPSVLLVGRNPFRGCLPIDECETFGYSDKPDNTDGCTDGINERTIACMTGYYVAGKGQTVTEITLKGKEPFPGCKEIDECVLYGGSSASYVARCVDKLNGREIFCKPGYKIGTGHYIYPSMVFTGSAAFTGCTDINECDYYGFSGKTNRTAGCDNLENARKITCAPGFYAVAPASAYVILNGNAPFLGCSDINECAVFGNNNKTLGYARCQDGVNERIITCQEGYYVLPNNPASLESRSVTLTGSAVFPGCTDVDECSVFGNSGKPDHVKGCVNGPVNSRIITCDRGYTIFHFDRTVESNTTLFSNSIFPGCVAWCGDSIKLPSESCDDGNRVSGDGCNSTCGIESGWNCGSGDKNQGKRCCKDMGAPILEYGLRETLECYDSWWVSPTASPIIFDKNTPLVVEEELRICGRIQLGQTTGGSDVSNIQLRDRTPTLVIASHVILAGTFEIFPTGGLWFRGANSLTLVHSCDSAIPVADKQFITTGTGMIAVEDIFWTWTQENPDKSLDDTPLPYIILEECSYIDQGGVYIHADTIPKGSNTFPLIQGRCTSNTNTNDNAFAKLDHLVPGHCSVLSTESDTAVVWVRTNYRDLCNGEKAAIGLLVVGFGAAVLGGAIFLLTAGGSAAPYAAL